MSARQTADPLDKGKTAVMSVRFGHDQMERIQAYATIFGMSPNAVVREAVDELLRTRTASPEFKQAAADHMRRAQLAVEVLAPSSPATEDQADQLVS
ncbi:hypothetical protein [Streptomyces sp. NRRL B-24484]|uniref:hypothetical protein n=1 Tax=Streptomyces sp. NRRL B-24484 TaxID=1463833 RepID=UPI001331ADFB|nr:hypothetical protein [Streptomyces sp. NRRL B-24484]